MRKSIRIAALSLFFLFVVISVVSAAEIDWISDYEKGLKKAKAENKNLFILITAPSWCGPCQWMEANTFTDNDVISLLNSEFVPVRVVDQKDGKRNPDLARFDFSGFPTVMVYNQKEMMLTSSVGAVDAATLIEKVKKYSDVDYDPSDNFLAFETDNGVLEQVGVKKWERRDNGTVTVYQEVNRDDFVYLYNEKDDVYIAVPINGGTVFETHDKGENWEQRGSATPK
jgi:thioredoxin-related protein